MKNITGARHRILLVDDHAILRAGLAHLLNHVPNLMVCGECDSGAKAPAKVEQTKADLVILDISLPGMNGIEVIKILRSQFRQLKILVLSMHDESLYGERALRAGAAGYVMKEASSDLLLQAIQKVLKGEIYLGSQLIRSRMTDAARQPLAKLSDRELEIVHLIGEGISTGEIAKDLGISAKTVEAHRGNIRRKLNLSSGAQLVRFALAHRSITAD